MKIKMTFENQVVIINLYENAVSRELISRLPLTLSFEDFAGKEKITYLAEPLSVKGSPAGASSLAGDVNIYIPWGNIAFFIRIIARERIIPYYLSEKSKAD